MSNVLITVEKKDNTTDHNVTLLSTIMSQMDTQLKVVKASNVTLKDIEWCDVYIANRPNSIYSQKISLIAKETGRFVIVAIDDDLLRLPNDHPDHWKCKYVSKCMETGDALLCLNPLLLDDYCELYNLRPIQYVSVVKENEIKPAHCLIDKLRIVYPAGKDHIEFFNKYINPFFNEIIRLYPDKIDVTFIGVEPNIKESNVVHFVKGMSYKDYLEYMYKHDFDIGLAPLVETPFCARKHFVKYLEYSKYGILGLYSDVKPYTYAIRDGYNGLLVNGGAEQWGKKLVELIKNPERINEIVSNSQNDLKERFSLEKAVQKLREGCPELEQYKAHKLYKKYYLCHPISIVFYKSREFLSKSFYHLRNDGFSYFIKKI